VKVGDQIGSYVIDSPIAGGGMGMVYRAHHIETGEFVALKLLLPGMALREKVRHRFEQEAYVQGKLVHPHIVHAREFLNEGNQLGIVFDLVEGPSLEDVLAENPQWSLSEIMEIIEPILEALKYAHGRGVIHRDLKPANILLDRKKDPTGLGIPRITDFGIAKIISEDPGIATRTGTRMGSVPFMAPEQFMGEKNIDARADVFAVGMILWRLVSRRFPINPDDMLAIMHLYAGETTVESLHTIHPEVPENFSKAVATAMQIDPQRRFFDANALAVALRSSVQGTVTVAKRASSSHSREPIQDLSPLAEETDLEAFSPGLNKSKAGLFAVIGVLVLGLLGFFALEQVYAPSERKKKDALYWEAVSEETSAKPDGSEEGVGQDRAPKEKGARKAEQQRPPDIPAGDEGNYEGGSDDVTHWRSGKIQVASCVLNHVETGQGRAKRFRTKWDLSYSLGMFAVRGITHGLNNMVCEGVTAPRYELEKVIRACMEEQGTAFVSLEFICGSNHEFYQFDIEGLVYSGEKYIRVKGWQGDTECPWVVAHEHIIDRSGIESLVPYMDETCIIGCDNPCTSLRHSNNDWSRQRSGRMVTQWDSEPHSTSNIIWDFVCAGYAYSRYDCSN
jgi:serine/threonine protein kinase